MLKVPQILVRAVGLVGVVAALAGCGQKGTLFLPTEPAARQRATLPQTLRPDWTRSRSGATGAPAPSPAAGAADTPAARGGPANPVPPTGDELVPETVIPTR